MKKITLFLVLMLSISIDVHARFNSPDAVDKSLLLSVPDEEKQVLIDLYNATGGDSWSYNKNWLSDEPVDTWSGVTVEDDHIVSINLYQRNLTGTLPESLKTLSYLKILDLTGNNLSGTLIDFSEMASLTQLVIIENNYSSNDIEVHYKNNSTLETFKFSPQYVGEVESIEGVLGNEYILTMPNIEGTNITYQWYRSRLKYLDGTDEIIENETNKDYRISSLTDNDFDIYVCKASSENFPELFFISRNKEIYGAVSDTEKNALIEFYKATNGDSWLNNTNWLTDEPVRNWFGVKVSGNKVVELDFVYNNLTGTLPADIGVFKELEWLIVWGNAIEGTLPEEIGNLTELKVVSFEENNFTGEIPESFKNLTKLRGFWLYDNHLTGTVPEYIRDFKEIAFLDVSYNEFYGKLPDFSELPKLVFLNISNNYFLASDFSDQFEAYQSMWKSHYYYSPQFSRNVPSYEEALLGSDFTLFVEQDKDSRRVQSFQWFKDGNAIDGAVNNSYVITNAMLEDNGAYNYEVYDSNIENFKWIGETITLEFKEKLSVDETHLEKVIELYPNPVIENVLRIKTNSNVEIQELQFYNVLGKEVKQISNPSDYIDLSHISAGMYVIKIYTSEGELSKRIIKM
ncbi:T9SS type A sorting domain-containing protein [Formosa haliotis]|uniref:T9SS type A sorting domain-containing protein n=1 Tax=Formosa haliotis TaxID=1555194 RepID=UPI000826DEA0|nr:T9SS type A sorting domain-containing protein [Formosa haliotis]